MITISIPDMIGTGEDHMEGITPEGSGKQDAKRAELLGKVLNLKDLVRYQEGTIASRMIVNRKAGNITLFSFDRDEGLSEHTAPYDAVVTILDGECEVWVGGTTHRMREGDTIIFPANVPHALSAITRFKMMLTMIRE
jgi:quercetin dioxygenase-like cupin family protein